MASQTSVRAATPSLATRRRVTDRLLRVGLAAVVAFAALLRLPHLDTGLPLLVRPDEPTVVERALAALDGQLLPPAFDWPPLSSYFTAAAVALARLVVPDLTEDRAALYLFARVLFLAVSLVAVALTGLLATRLADRRRDRFLVGLGAALAFAVSYLSVRGSRIAHPEHLQIVFVLLSLLAALAFDRTRSTRLLAAAGLLAGLAGATKYLGVTAALPAGLAVLAYAGTTWAGRARHLVLLAAATLTGVVAGTLGTVLTRRFVEGFAWQWAHQAGGHLGYEAASTGWWFHLTTSLPGNWGPPFTLLAFAGLVAVLVRGTRAQRLVGALTVALFAVIGLSRVAFPHYALLLVPLLAPFALVAVARVARVLSALAPPAARRFAGPLAVTLALATLVPTVLHDLRFVRAAGATDTRVLAADVLDTLPAGAWVEGHTVPQPALRPGDTPVYAFGHSPDVVRCDCVVLVSSYQEQRFRRLPQRYADEVAVYDALRARGSVLTEIAPSQPLSYRWDLLPQWGVARLPLRRPIELVGPTITVLDLRGAARSSASG